MNFARRHAWLREHGPRFGLDMRRYAYPILKDALAFNDPGGHVVSHNDSEMSATAVISTSSRDRDRDVVLASAFDLTNYRNNPVVFFGHQSIPLPVGKSKDKNGNLSIIVGSDKVIATCYFHQHTKEAVQIYALVRDEFLNGTSVGYKPIEAERMKADLHSMEPTTQWPGWLFKKVELLEWSWVGIPANPEAVRATLSKGMLAGEPMLDSIRQALEPFSEIAPCWAPGATMPQSIDTPQAIILEKKHFDCVKKARRWVDNREYDSSIVTETPTTFIFTQFPSDRCAAAGQTKSLAAGVSAVCCETNMQKEYEENPDMTKPEQLDPNPSLGEEDPKEMDKPLGAMCLEDLIKHLEHKAPLIEQDKVKKFYMKLLTQAKAIASQIYPSHFSAGEPKVDETEKAPDPEAEDAPKLVDDEKGPAQGRVAPPGEKSFKYKGDCCKCMKEAGEFLTEAAGHEGMPKMLAAGCKYHASELVKSMGLFDGDEEVEEKQVPPATPPAAPVVKAYEPDPTELLKALAELRLEVQSITGKID